MRANPDHYVALVTHRAGADTAAGKPHPPQELRGAARVTRVKLLKPRDTLALRQAYRLITVAEVTKALQAKKEEKTRRAQQHVLLQPKHAGGRPAATAGEDSQPPPELEDGTLDQQVLFYHPLVTCSVSLFSSSRHLCSSPLVLY
jgi:hypothetical protein